MPSAPDSPSPEPLPAKKDEPLPGSGTTILLADDDDILRELFATVLRDLGYEVITAPDGQAALDILKTDGGPRVNLLLTDYRMPFMKGDELALRFREANPGAPIIVMSGESPELSPTLRCRFISKPFPIYSLGEVVAGALTGAAA